MRLMFVIWLLPVFAFAQEVKDFSSMFTVHHYRDHSSFVESKNISAQNQLIDFINKAEAKRPTFSSDANFVRYIFDRTHRKFLKQFTPTALFNEVFSNGKYNCLSGTAMYALMLQHFNIEYKIIETNYHIFILAQAGDKQILLEATDPLKGYEDNEERIAERIQNYRKNEIAEAGGSKKSYEYSFDLYNEVGLHQLPSLMLYNLAIQDLNIDRFESAINHLEEALEHYNSPRTEEFTRVILLSVIESPIDSTKKEGYVKRLQSLRKKHLMTLAQAH